MIKLSPLEKRRQEIEYARMRSQRAKTGPLDFEGLACMALGVKRLLPTQKQFIECNDRIALYRGPVGCAKSVSLVGSILMPALLLPGSRWGLFRAHWWTLQPTTLEVLKGCLRRLGPGAMVDKQEGPPYRVWINPAVLDENGRPGEPSEVLCYGLDDLEKLGSQEFTGVAIDEVSEVGEHVAHTLNTRLRHKRSGQEGAVGPFFWRGACNPTNRAHWIHRQFCAEHDCMQPPWGRLFKPHPRENVENLPPNYYNDISAGMSTGMKVRFVEGECGADPTGTPVFPEFSRLLHCENFKYLPNVPLWLSFDFGRRRPACLMAQITPDGCTNVLHAELGNNESLQNFAGRMKMIVQIRFPQAGEIRVVCDPHGTQRKDTTEKTSIDVLRELGLPPRYRSVSVAMGLEFISKGLNTLIRGRPRLRFDARHCTVLVEGFEGGYCWSEGKETKQEPEKNGLHDHLMDCLRYLEVNTQLGSAVEQHEWPDSLMKSGAVRS